MKKSKFLILAAVLVYCLGMLAACDSKLPADTTQATEPQDQKLSYSVTVLDAAGEPYTSDVIVRFLKGSEQIAMQPVNGSGTAVKELDAGEYTFELVFTGDESGYYYDKSDLNLSADNTQRTVLLNSRVNGEAVSLFAQNKENKAYRVSAGGTYVDLIPGQRNYFLFAPQVAGTYEFTTDQGTAIGYYGAPHFVQDANLTDVVDNIFTLSINAGMIGGTYVIGVDTEEAVNCVLTIRRIGDPQRTIEDEPWIIYEPRKAPEPFTLSGTGTLVDFDLTADGYTLVLNEKDGFYHLDTADGPLVLVRMGVSNAYLDSFKVILEHTGVNRYFFSDSGEFVKKESYSDCLLSYIACMDGEKGVYPLTEDLKYIIQQEGEDSGWWDVGNSLYLFVNEAGNPIPGINNDIAWLFMCCYQAQ